MPSNDRAKLAFALLLLCGLDVSAAEPMPAVKPETVGLSSARLERLAQAIKLDVNGGRMARAGLALARQGKLAFYESFCFVGKTADKPMPPDAVFSLAPLTKPLGGAA